MSKNSHKEMIIMSLFLNLGSKLLTQENNCFLYLIIYQTSIRLKFKSLGLNFKYKFKINRVFE